MIIDPEIEKFFPPNFLEKELLHFPEVKEIKANRFFYAVRNCFGSFLPEDGTMILDTSVSPKIIAASTNRNHPDFNLTENEAWIFMFFHEAFHSMKGAGEWSADNFSIKKIMERRAEQKKIYDFVRRAIREGVRVVFKEIKNQR